MNSRPIRFLFTFFLGPVVLSLSGCSALRAVSLPGKKDLSVFKIGTDRADIVAAHGNPDSSEQEGDKLTDFYYFKAQGHDMADRAEFLVLGAVAGILTCGFTEIIALEEMRIDHTRSCYYVIYDHNLKIVDMHPSLMAANHPKAEEPRELEEEEPTEPRPLPHPSEV